MIKIFRWVEGLFLGPQTFDAAVAPLRRQQKVLEDFVLSRREIAETQRAFAERIAARADHNEHEADKADLTLGRLTLLIEG